jgi:hypothetical protein
MGLLYNYMAGYSCTIKGLRPDSVGVTFQDGELETSFPRDAFVEISEQERYN